MAALERGQAVTDNTVSVQRMFQKIQKARSDEPVWMDWITAYGGDKIDGCYLWGKK